MSRMRRGRVHFVYTWAGMVALLMLTAFPSAAVAQQGNPEAAEHLNNAIAALQGESADPQKALDEIDKVLELDPQNAQAFFYRGMARGQMQQLPEALEAFLEAGALAPGYTDAYVWACRLAFQFQDWPVAWEQAILASQSGFDMSQAFTELRQVAGEPDDFEHRLRAPRILLGPVDVEAITGQDSFLNDPVSNDTFGGGGVRADAAPPSDGSLAFGDGPAGTTIFAESQADITNVRRTFGVLLQESRDFAVVQNADLATYVMTLKVNDIGAGRPRHFEGIVKFMLGDEEVYSRPIRLSDIGSTSELRTEIFRVVVFMEEWLEEQER